MKWEAPLTLSVEGLQALDHSAYVLKYVEDFSAVVIRSYLSDVRQFVHVGNQTERITR